MSTDTPCNSSQEPTLASLPRGSAPGPLDRPEVAVNDWPRHIVAAGAFVERGQDVLLVQTSLRGWETPGGQVEVGETLVDAVEREVNEEAGVAVTVGALIGVYSNIKPPTKVIFLFRADWQSGEPTAGDECVDAAWVNRDAALDLVSEGPDRDRIRDGLEFDGKVRYRVYTNRPYIVRGERWM